MGVLRGRDLEPMPYLMILMLGLITILVSSCLELGKGIPFTPRLCSQSLRDYLENIWHNKPIKPAQLVKGQQKCCAVRQDTTRTEDLVAFFILMSSLVLMCS